MAILFAFGEHFPCDLRHLIGQGHGNNVGVRSRSKPLEPNQEYEAYLAMCPGLMFVCTAKVTSQGRVKKDRSGVVSTSDSWRDLEAELTTKGDDSRPSRERRFPSRGFKKD